MSVTEVFTNAASLAIASTAGLGAVAWFSRKTWQGIGRVRRFLDDYEGTEARRGRPAQAGVMERLLIIDGRLQAGDQRFANIDARIGDLSGQVEHVMDELPKNGKPAAEKLDAVYQWILEQRLLSEPKADA